MAAASFDPDALLVQLDEISVRNSARFLHLRFILQTRPEFSSARLHLSERNPLVPKPKLFSPLTKMDPQEEFHALLGGAPPSPELVDQMTAAVGDDRLRRYSGVTADLEVGR